MESSALSEAATAATAEAPSGEPPTAVTADEADVEVGSKRKAGDDDNLPHTLPSQNYNNSNRPPTAITAPTPTTNTSADTLAGGSTDGGANDLSDAAEPDAKRLRIAAAYAARSTELASSVPSAAPTSAAAAATTTTFAAASIGVTSSTASEAGVAGHAASMDEAFDLPVPVGMAVAAEDGEKSTSPTPEVNENGEEIFCFCRNVWGDRFMLECGSCKEWCVRIPLI